MSQWYRFISMSMKTAIAGTLPSRGTKPKIVRVVLTMGRYSLFAVSLIAFVLALSVPAHAGYWFQSGARAGSDAAQNGGASVSIQTVVPQAADASSMAFWVGENLPNGAFLQVGYVVENQSGNYPAECTASGCSGTEYLTAGNAEWFYEYFLPNQNDSFMGRIGPDASAGANGTFNTYSFLSSGNTWSFLFNGNQVGSVDLGASSSGSDLPVALGEVANTSSNVAFMKNVIFANLSAYKNGAFSPVSSGYGSISYGVGSQTALPNPYGVKEVGSRTNYFTVGSGLPLDANNTRLWTLGYSVNVISQYGNLSGRNGYVAYTTVVLSAPETIYLDNATRVSFLSWSGSGVGAYTGYLNNVSLVLDGNVTERANWQLQYFVNVSTPQSSATGNGWYNSGSLERYGVANAFVYENGTDRYAFDLWSNGNKNLSGTVVVGGPLRISAGWLHEYLVNATSSYGNATGSGWYESGSYANLSVPAPVVNVSPGERIAFVSWSNGNENSTIRERIASPLSLRAQFNRQYLIGLSGENNQGNQINVSYFVLNGKQASSSIFLDANRTYVLDGVYYKGVFLPVNLTVPASAPSTFNFSLPVYDVMVRTVDLFGLPVNSSVSLVFDNLSHSQTSSGASGAVRVMNVPYGRSNVTAHFLGMTERASTYGGKETSLVFVSATNVISIAVLLFVIALLVVLRRKRVTKGTTELPASNAKSS